MRSQLPLECQAGGTAHRGRGGQAAYLLGEAHRRQVSDIHLKDESAAGDGRESCFDCRAGPVAGQRIRPLITSAPKPIFS